MNSKNTYKKFAFINLPSQELERPPAAAAVLSGILESKGFSTKIFDFNLFLNQSVSNDEWIHFESFWRGQLEKLDYHHEKKLETVLTEFSKKIKDYAPDFIGASVFSKFSIIPCLHFLTFMRKVTDCQIIVGGHGINDNALGSSKFNLKNNKSETLGQYLLRSKLIDFYVVGDAENSLPELLNGNVDYPGINGKPPMMVTNLNSFPPPNYKDIKPLDYYYTYQPGIYMTNSKGCVRNCSFCDIPDIWPKFTVRDPELVAKEIVHYRKTLGVKIIHFTDSLINGSLKHFRALNEKLIEYKKNDPSLNDIKYMGQFICRRQSEQTDGDWEMMAKAGAHVLVTGIESYSERVRTHMGKHYSNDDIAYQYEQSGRFGIRNIALMFVGYPTETLEDHEMNKQFLIDFQKYAKTGIINMVRWGYTGRFIETNKIMSKGQVDMSVDPTFAKQIENLPYGIKDIAIGFGWFNKKNPSLTISERIRRRIELHELSVKLGWPQTRNKEELTILLNIMKNFNSGTFDRGHISDLENLLDYH